MKTDNDNSKNDSLPGEQSWLERNVNVVIAGLVIACIATLAAQLVYGSKLFEHHPAHFEIETVFGFEGLFGFIAFVVVVLLGRFLRLFVKREEDYYDS